MLKKELRVISILAILLMSCGEDSRYPIFHPSHEASRSEAPFSDAVETKDLLFLTGQIGKNHKKGVLVDGGIKAETEQVIANIKEVLAQHQLSLDHVVKCTVILKDINDFAEFNSVYVKHFTKKPSRTTFAASGLAGGASIEIDVIVSIKN